jgi:hypothetical protein
MKMLTISIDGQSRADLVKALAEVMANLTSGIDTSSYQNEQLSYSYGIREYELPAVDYEAAAAEHQDKAERARFRYLPADELMQQAGYKHYAYGAYSHRPAAVTGRPLGWPLHRVSFFSESGNCVLSRVRSEFSLNESVAAEVVTTDEQLQQFLQRHEFPSITPKL